MATTEELKQQIIDLKAEIVALEAKNASSKAAQTVRDLYESYLEVGFSDTQAFDLTTLSMQYANRGF